MNVCGACVCVTGIEIKIATMTNGFFFVLGCFCNETFVGYLQFLIRFATCVFFFIFLIHFIFFKSTFRCCRFIHFCYFFGFRCRHRFHFLLVFFPQLKSDSSFVTCLVIDVFYIYAREHTQTHTPVVCEIE